MRFLEARAEVAAVYRSNFSNPLVTLSKEVIRNFWKEEKYVSNNIEIYCEKLLGHMTKGHYAKEHILIVGLLQSVMQPPILHAHTFCVLEILKLLLWNNLYLDKAVNPQWIEN